MCNPTRPPQADHKGRPYYIRAFARRANVGMSGGARSGIVGPTLAVGLGRRMGIHRKDMGNQQFLALPSSSNLW